MIQSVNGESGPPSERIVAAGRGPADVTKTVSPGQTIPFDALVDGLTEAQKAQIETFNVTVQTSNDITF